MLFKCIISIDDQKEKVSLLSLLFFLHKTHTTNKKYIHMDLKFLSLDMIQKILGYLDLPQTIFDDPKTLFIKKYSHIEPFHKKQNDIAVKHMPLKHSLLTFNGKYQYDNLTLKFISNYDIEILKTIDFTRVKTVHLHVNGDTPFIVYNFFLFEFGEARKMKKYLIVDLKYGKNTMDPNILNLLSKAFSNNQLVKLTFESSDGVTLPLNIPHSLKNRFISDSQITQNDPYRKEISCLGFVEFYELIQFPLGVLLGLRLQYPKVTALKFSASFLNASIQELGIYYCDHSKKFKIYHFDDEDIKTHNAFVCSDCDKTHIRVFPNAKRVMDLIPCILDKKIQKITMNLVCGVNDMKQSEMVNAMPNIQFNLLLYFLNKDHTKTCEEGLITNERTSLEICEIGNFDFCLKHPVKQVKFLHPSIKELPNVFEWAKRHEHLVPLVIVKTPVYVFKNRYKNVIISRK